MDNKFACPMCRGRRKCPRYTDSGKQKVFPRELLTWTDNILILLISVYRFNLGEKTDTVSDESAEAFDYDKKPADTGIC